MTVTFETSPAAAEASGGERFEAVGRGERGVRAVSDSDGVGGTSRTNLVTHHHRSGERIITSILREGSLVLSPPEIEVAIADLFVSVDL